MKHNIKDDAIKAFKKANRELELERNGYAHPWVAKTVAFKNKKKYDRKQNKKSCDYLSHDFFLF